MPCMPNMSIFVEVAIKVLTLTSWHDGVSIFLAAFFYHSQISSGTSNLKLARHMYEARLLEIRELIAAEEVRFK